jgi:hypothetical protein
MRRYRRVCSANSRRMISRNRQIKAIRQSEQSGSETCVSRRGPAKCSLRFASSFAGLSTLYCPCGGDCVYRTASATATNATGSDQAQSLSSETSGAADSASGLSNDSVRCARPPPRRPGGRHHLGATHGRRRVRCPSIKPERCPVPRCSASISSSVRLLMSAENS